MFSTNITVKTESPPALLHYMTLDIEMLQNWCIYQHLRNCTCWYFKSDSLTYLYTVQKTHATCALSVHICFEIIPIELNPLPRYASVPYLCERLHHSREAVQRRKGCLCVCSLPKMSFECIYMVFYTKLATFL